LGPVAGCFAFDPVAIYFKTHRKRIPRSGPISANLTPRGVLMSVRMSACAGPEGRQRVAHGVSRGIEEPSDYLSPGGAAEAPTPDLSPLPGSVNLNAASGPTPLRRGLVSAAAPRLPRSSGLKLALMVSGPGTRANSASLRASSRSCLGIYLACTCPSALPRRPISKCSFFVGHFVLNCYQRG